MIPHPPYICNQVNCAKCGYFATYSADNDSEGECWRFPHREVIERPHAHSCAEGREWYDDRGEIPHSSQQSSRDVKELFRKEIAKWKDEDPLFMAYVYGQEAGKKEEREKVLDLIITFRKGMVNDESKMSNM